MNTKTILFISAVGMVFVYMLGAFYAVSFDISLWTKESRSVVIIAWFGVACYTVLACVLNKRKRDE